MAQTRRSVLVSAAGLAGGLAFFSVTADAASAHDITERAQSALKRLYAEQPHLESLGERAQAILVFPEIVKAGLVIGGQTGNGALLEKGTPIGYYNISAVSFGLQAGAQAFSYALFFMKNSALEYLRKSKGWAIGSGPSVVVLDKGAAASITSTTVSQAVYAVPFGQHGLMAGVSIEGSKITRIHPGA